MHQQRRDDILMSTAIHRHDISDKAWALIEPHMLGQKGQWSGIAQDNRKFINAVFWILRTGAPWRAYSLYRVMAKCFIVGVCPRCLNAVDRKFILYH